MLILQIPASLRDPSQEEVTEQAYREPFRNQSRSQRDNFKRQISRAMGLVVVGFFFLLASQLVGESSLEPTLRHTLSDVVRVGGWVARWTAIAAVFFEASDSLQKWFTFRRLARLPIHFDYRTRGSSLDGKGLATSRHESVVPRVSPAHQCDMSSTASD